MNYFDNFNIKYNGEIYIPLFRSYQCYHNFINFYYEEWQREEYETNRTR